MEHRMTLNRFQDILDIYGADSTRWPADERAAAVAFLKASAQAQEAFEEARALDVLLGDTADCPPAPLDLRDRIMAALPPLPEQTAPVSSPSVPNVVSLMQAAPSQKGAWRVPAAALAASLVLGILSGAMVKSRLPVAAQPSLDQVFTIGFTTQLAVVSQGQSHSEDVE